MKRMAIFIGIFCRCTNSTQLNSERGRYAWNESNGRESAQKGRHEDEEEEEEKEEQEEDEQQGGCGSCINMTTFCQRFLPGTAVLAIKQFAQIVAMILYQLLSQRKSPGQIAHTPRKPSPPALLCCVLCVINFWHLKKAFGKRHIHHSPVHIYMPRRGGVDIFSNALLDGALTISPRNA